MEIYNKLKEPPAEALKPIQAGRLKGKMDISPQWRIQAMTEQFGMCGIGWKTVITKQWTEQADNGQIFAFVNIDLYIKHDNEWSEPIQGTGGTLLVVQERTGMYSDDEAFKKSFTDALGFAMKFLGMAADVYMGKMNGKINEGPKYTDQKQQPEKKDEQPKVRPDTAKQNNFETRDLTKKEVDTLWGGKIYKGSVYINDKRIVPTKDQIERLKAHPKYIPS